MLAQMVYASGHIVSRAFLSARLAFFRPAFAADPGFRVHFHGEGIFRNERPEAIREAWQCG
jgi:hypothetical protein